MLVQNTSNQTKGHPAAPALRATFGLTVKLGGCATRPDSLHKPQAAAELEQCSPSSQFDRQTEAAQKGLGFVGGARVFGAIPARDGGVVLRCELPRRMRLEPVAQCFVHARLPARAAGAESVEYVGIEAHRGGNLVASSRATGCALELRQFGIGQGLCIRVLQRGGGDRRVLCRCWQFNLGAFQHGFAKADDATRIATINKCNERLVRQSDQARPAWVHGSVGEYPSRSGRFPNRAARLPPETTFHETSFLSKSTRIGM